LDFGDERATAAARSCSRGQRIASGSRLISHALSKLQARVPILVDCVSHRPRLKGMARREPPQLLQGNSEHGGAAAVIRLGQCELTVRPLDLSIRSGRCQLMADLLPPQRRVAHFRRPAAPGCTAMGVGRCLAALPEPPPGKAHLTADRFVRSWFGISRVNNRKVSCTRSAIPSAYIQERPKNLSSRSFLKT